MHYETVTEKMREVAKRVSQSIDNGFYLAGGTALALQIGHRTSIDLDYFSPQPIDTEKLKNQFFEIFEVGSVDILFEEKNTLWCIIDGVKVSFIMRKDTLLKPTTTTDEFTVASIEDITVMKLSAICSREEFKDYFDLACISTMTDVRSWVSWWEEVHPHVDITAWIVALSSVDTIQPIHIEIFGSFKELNTQNRVKMITGEITSFLQ